ncbi:MAG: FAD-binding protein [Clostridia bacterium]|nr:FAD-binding protein [Clostridia bacterium]
MKTFEHYTSKTFEEASELLKQGKNVVVAGGTDLFGTMSKAILPEYPEAVIDLKEISEGEGIKDNGGTIEIGALTKLADVVDSQIILKKAPAMAQAAHSVATSIVRNTGTVGGNVCQDVRCWYYRYPHEGGGRFLCQRKGGAECYAVHGDNRYHSIFGGMKAGITPCTRECPAGTDIPAYMEKLRAGDYDGAAEIIMEVNPMPMITSRICPHPCQDKCNQLGNGDCVNIHAVERSMGDYILADIGKFYPAPKTETGKKLAVIGAGPSGLTCAYFMRKQGHSVTVIDKMEKAGGVLMYGIPHYRLPKHYVDDFVAALEGMGVKFDLGKTVGADISMDAIISGYDSVYLATGAWKQPILGIDGENLTMFGLDFLVEVNKYLKKVAQFGNNVLVCGGGNVAMDVALTAVRLGAKNVTLVCLEKESEMPATSEEIERAKEEGVTIINSRGLSKVVEKNGKVIGLETKACTSVFDENRRFSPKYDEADKTIIEADSIILATGQRVDLDFLGNKYAEKIKSQRGLIEVNQESFKTNLPNVYGGGDAVTGPNLAVRAIAAGSAAAKHMSRDLGFPFERGVKGSEFLSCDAESVAVKESVKLKEVPLGQRSLDKEDAVSLSKEETAKEAGRCMNCGCYSVNASDITPVLIAFDADIVTTSRTIKAKELFTTKLKVSDMLEQGELVKAVIVPDMEDYETHYEKLRVRDAVDFAIVSLATAYKLKDGRFHDARIVLGGVAPVPVELGKVEKLLEGKTPTAELVKQAGELAVKGVVPLRKNQYKITQARALVERFVEGAGK